MTTPTRNCTAGLDEIVREGARRMLAAALEAEVDGYVAALADEWTRGATGWSTRNGHAEPRTITTAAGGIEIEAPRVDDRRVDPEIGRAVPRSASAIVPPWCRKSPKVAEVLPLLYLHGMSSGDFAPALEEFFGTAAGLSPSVITRLTKQWQAEQRAFSERRLDDRDYVYIWADGIHFNVRLEEARLCALVIVGVRADGTKELVAITDGHRESTEQLGRCAARPQAPGHAGADGGRGRRRPRVLGCAAQGVARDHRAAVLGAQGRQRAQRPAQVGAADGAADAGRDPRRRGPRARPAWPSTPSPASSQ